MAPIILSINAGSSSVKISVYTAPDSTTPKLLAEATIEGLTAPPALLTYSLRNNNPTSTIKGKQLPDITTQDSAFHHILSVLTSDPNLVELRDKSDITHTCHRIVHGGTYSRSHIISPETYEHIASLSDLAPLHNTPALSIVRSTTTLLPHATNIAYFDSAFHAKLPKHVYTYPINPDIAKKNMLRKYGFHGLSYASILRSVSTYLDTPSTSLNIIALHLGSGASICCIRNGVSIDTTMGLTPLSGLPGATRSGSIDPSLIFHFTHSAGKPSREESSDMHITQAEQILNKEAGWKALTGTTDFGKISSEAEKEGEDGDMKLAFDIFVDRILGYVPSYFAKLDGRVGALVFAGGIGERGAKLRKAVVDGVRCLGFAVDEGKNEAPEDEVVADISTDGARYKTLVVKTDEQLEMARGVLEDRARFEKER